MVLAGRRLFVSMLFAERWVHLDDVQLEDLVFQIVRQLVFDLKQAGFTFAETSFRNALGSLRDFLRGRVVVDSADIGADPLSVSLRFEAFPTDRKKFRNLLQGLLPTIYDLTNNEILAKARAWLEQPEHGGYADIAIIVDQLDRIPRKPLNGYHQPRKPVPRPRRTAAGAGLRRALHYPDRVGVQPRVRSAPGRVRQRDPGVARSPSEHT